MKIYLDDVRDPPDADWVVARRPEDAIRLLERGGVELLSFDFDLGMDGDQELSGYSVLTWIEEQVVLNDFDPPVMRVHSANPPGHERLLRGIEAINRHVRERLPQQAHTNSDAQPDLEGGNHHSD
jgi:hypothetical protein